MTCVLSIQSHVAYGYVGNRAACFPLERLGHEVIAVHTVQFSNHTGYGSWTGEVFAATHIESIINGIADRGVFPHIDAVISGYMGDASLGAVVTNTVARVKAANPKAIYCCDPVMGDVGRGLFVRPNLPDFFKDTALPVADILTPNLFELEVLTGGAPLRSISDIHAACRTLHARGPQTLLVTSVDEAASPNIIGMFASHANGSAYYVRTPRLALTPAPNGAGDLTAALFTAAYLDGLSLEDALTLTAARVFTVMEATQHAHTRELALINSQKAWVTPSHIFKATICD